MAFVLRRNWSASVLLPWSMWAMMEKLRIRRGSAVALMRGGFPGSEQVRAPDQREARLQGVYRHAKIANRASRWRYNDGMARVFIPPQMRDVTGGRETVEVTGATVGQIIERLDGQFPGMRNRLCQGKDLKPGLAAIVDGQVARWGLREKVGEESEVHFLPAIGGG